MIKLISQWFESRFSNKQAAILTWILLLLVAIVFFFGNVLAPVFAAVVLTYLLDDVVEKIRPTLGRTVAVAVVFVCFLASIVFVLTVILPLVSQQLTQFASRVPSYLAAAQGEVRTYIQAHPDLFDAAVLEQVGDNLTEAITNFSQEAVSRTFSVLPNLIGALIYLVIVPMLALFLLKDKEKILTWGDNFLPTDYSLAQQVWGDVDQQLGNYIRGKVIEIVVVGFVTYLGFAVFKLQYALMLAVLVGLSVLIPYVGATVVTIPVALVAFTQFGLGETFVYVMVVYLVLQALDGYVLVPLLFSEAVDMHPAAILIAILFFGGLFGFWGLFFAIPLAVLVQAVILAWPREVSGEN